MTRLMKWVFEFVLRKKLGLKKGSTGPNVKWYESENVWAGIAVGIYGVYEIARQVAPLISPDIVLPPVPETWLAYTSILLGGGIVWSRVTAERVIK